MICDCSPAIQNEFRHLPSRKQRDHLNILSSVDDGSLLVLSLQQNHPLLLCEIPQWVVLAPATSHLLCRGQNTNFQQNRSRLEVLSRTLDNN